MVLSNTATPIYYGEFRKRVLSGEIMVCHEISLEMNRIDDLIRNDGIYYDSEAVEGWIRFCENELTLTDGTPFKMLPSFKLWGEQIFGWYYFIEQSVYVSNPDGHGGHFEKRRFKKRLINKQYLIVSRGNAKSMYESCIQSYFLVMDTTTTHHITVAPTMSQADEVMSPIKTAITRSRGPLFKFLTSGAAPNGNVAQAQSQQLVSTKKGIEDRLTNSLLEIRPMSVDKLQGLRTKYNTIDEWLSGDVRENVVGAVEQGAQKFNNYLIVATSSEGTVRNSAGDSVKMELMDILKGEYQDIHTSIFYYRLDDVKEVADPDTWVKANPNIGATISYETLQREAERAEKSPASRNDIMAKRFGIPMEGYTYFFTYEETIPHRRRDFWGLPCSMGADLSQGDDFCSFSFLFPLPNDCFGVKTLNYISSSTLFKLSPAPREKYNEFINEGSLRIMDGTVLDMMEIFEDLDDFIIKSKFDVRTFGYDPYNARGFVERWSKENGEFGVTKVIQGARTESVPLGEIKKLAEDRKFVFDQKLMSFALGNCITLEDTNGNRKLYKKRREDKIDAVAAAVDALVAYHRGQEAFE